MNSYKIGDIVIYGAEGLCKVEAITEKEFDGQKIKYYALKQLGRNNSVTYVPTNNEKSLGKMRLILTKEEIMELIQHTPEGGEKWIDNARQRQLAFKETILYGDSKDLIHMVRSLYSHQKELNEKGKKLHLSDEKFFKEAQKIICEEIAYVFEIEQEEVLDFIAAAKA